MRDAGTGATEPAGTPRSVAARVLVVDDEDDVRGLVARVLGEEGYRVEEAADAPAAFDVLSRHPIDLVILDIMLPTEDGHEVLARVRRTSDVPVIFLTGRGLETDRILGLKLGADDYVVKPFSTGELAARVASVLRRTRPRQPIARHEFAGLVVDLTTRETRVDGTPVDLTAKEFDLLAFLAGSPRQVFTREQLLQQVWASSSEWQEEATVTEHVRRVRRKIEADPDRPRWIRTIRGVGYRFEP